MRSQLSAAMAKKQLPVSDVACITWALSRFSAASRTFVAPVATYAAPWLQALNSEALAELTCIVAQAGKPPGECCLPAVLPLATVLACRLAHARFEALV